ncbi:hypothetical protein HTV45_13830 [Streptomyces sp. CHD11]|uniref:hypothetical protein n=1 Tax=Streptomyces sp. CHD11 TaxID=2741325 RepID=UPI001BFC1BC9|nr:hypothetical protein [Streptomyces sp. CHD11]MBT3151955.1 hypothetical protein [Streptomyces sp. CHD11]
MSRALPKYHKRRVVLMGGTAALALTGAVIAGTALAGESPGDGAGADARTLAGPGTISCPDVAPLLPAVPASAQAEVTRNLGDLDRQIDEADQRLADTVGQGGPDFVQNAILGPLEDKRVAAINRIATAIGRTAERPAGLDALAPCSLAAQGGAADQQDTGGEEDPAPPADEAGQGAGQDAGEDPGQAEETGAGTVSCPDVAPRLPAVPASAQAEVTRNLGDLDRQIDEADQRLADTVGQGGPDFVQNAILGPLEDKRQIDEADQRLADTVGQGGPDFVQNAILGPLEDKRVAAINRIATAIGRTAERPAGLDSLAACSLTK